MALIYVSLLFLGVSGVFALLTNRVGKTAAWIGSIGSIAGTACGFARSVLAVFSALGDAGKSWRDSVFRDLPVFLCCLLPCFCYPRAFVAAVYSKDFCAEHNGGDRNLLVFSSNMTLVRHDAGSAEAFRFHFCLRGK